MKIHRKKIKELFEVLNNINLYEMPISSSFRFLVTSNLQLLSNELNIIEIVMKDPPEWLEYKNKRIELLLSFNVKDEESLKNLNDQSRKELEEKMIVLNQEYATIIERMSVMESDRKDFMNMEIEIPLKTVHIDKAPDLAKNTQNHWGVWNAIKIFFHD